MSLQKHGPSRLFLAQALSRTFSFSYPASPNNPLLFDRTLARLLYNIRLLYPPVILEPSGCRKCPQKVLNRTTRDNANGLPCNLGSNRCTPILTPPGTHHITPLLRQLLMSTHPMLFHLLSTSVHPTISYPSHPHLSLRPHSIHALTLPNLHIRPTTTLAILVTSNLQKIISQVPALLLNPPSRR
jgi:hypothetical protein